MALTASAAPAQRPGVTVTLEIEEIDLRGRATSESHAGRVFSDAPLPFGQSSADGVSLDIHLGRLRLAAGDLEDVRVVQRLRDDRLILEPLTGRLAGGRLDARVVVDMAQTPPAVSLSVRAQGVELGQLPALREALRGAPADVQVELTGTGWSLRQILASANGRVSVAVGAGTVLSDVALAEGDLFMQTLRLFDPRERGEAQTRLTCGALRAELRDGTLRIDKGLALETDKVYLVGSGALRLADESLDIGMRPGVREGLGLGAAGLAKVVRITGTLSEPTLTTDVGGVAETGVQVGAALATGGLSVLAEKLFKDSLGDARPCFTLLGKTPPPDGRGVADTVKSAAGTLSDTVKSTTEGVGRGVKKLFEKTKDTVTP